MNNLLEGDIPELNGSAINVKLGGIWVINDLHLFLQKL